jgi:radical SAM superfamily enzyme YgiQ (UPF0313 family)
MVDVVLLNPIDKTQLKTRLGLKVPPLNLMYLASVLEKVSRSVKIIDDNLYEIGAERIAKFISKFDPLVVGVTAATATLKSALRYIELIKKLLPDALTVIGGPHVTFLPLETLRGSEGLDVVVIGEGEETITDLVENFEKKGVKGLDDVRGIAYKRGKKLKINPVRPPIGDLDSIPFPARHLVAFESYKLFDTGIGSMITSRGCVFACGFCSSSLMMGKRFRTRSPENVVDEMEELVYKYRIKDIEFLDDIFILNKKRAHAIAEEIKKRKLDVRYVASSRVDMLDPELLLQLRKSGLDSMYYGVESGSQQILNLMKKQITLRQAEDAVKVTKRMGIKVITSFILGYPGETIEDLDRTIDFSIKLDPDYAQYSILTPYPGTPIYYELKEKGLLDTEDWDKYTVLDPVIKYERLGLSKELVKKKLIEAYLRFYTRPRYLIKHPYMLKVLINTFLRSYIIPRLVGEEYRNWYTDLVG